LRTPLHGDILFIGEPYVSVYDASNDVFA